MRKFYVQNLDKGQDFSLCGHQVKTIRRNGKEVENDEGVGVWTESVFVETECDSIEVSITAKGRWAPLVNQQTRKPYGLVFKSKHAPMRILIVAPMT